MNDFGHGGSLNIIKALPDNAETITFEVTEDDFGEIGLSGWQLLLPVTAPSFLRSSEFMKSLSATASVGILSCAS